MSFYSTFDENVNYDVEPRFTGEDGAAALMIESLNFEEQITLDMLKSDYLEAKAIKESASEEEIAAITEASIKSIAIKIKNFFIKLGKRIKEFVLGWVARIRAKLTSNNEKFYNKYKDQVNNAGDMKVDYRAVVPFAKFAGGINNPGTAFDAVFDAYKIKTDSFKHPNTVEDTSDVDKEEVKNDAVCALFGFNDLKFNDLKKTLEDHAYKTSGKEEVTFDRIRGEVEGLLKNGNKVLDDLKKGAENNDRECKEIASDAEKDLENTRLAQKMSAAASTLGAVMSRSFSAVMSIYKEQLSQARSVFAKAVQYRPKED